MPGEEGTVKKEKKEVTHDWFVMTPDGKPARLQGVPRRFPVWLPCQKGTRCCSPDRRRTCSCGPDALKGTRGLRTGKRCRLPALDAQRQDRPRPARRLRAPARARVWRHTG
ncbi:MAG: hypothetical protein MZU97_02970 [Bacillus subtilis]|nr:hypothetical protein [Bacillus subtilis]